MNDNHPSTHEVFVNDVPVKIATEKQVLGRHIKEAAIEQGVAIQLDFLIFETGENGTREVKDNDHIHIKGGERFVAHQKEVTILVNERPVKMEGHRVTGLEIKKTAIAQQVPIQLDFVLSEELGDRRSRIIGDADEVHIHNKSRFIAVAPDDNS